MVSTWGLFGKLDVNLHYLVCTIITKMSLVQGLTEDGNLRTGVYYTWNCLPFNQHLNYWAFAHHRGSLKGSLWAEPLHVSHFTAITADGLSLSIPLI